jgi:hypothetical protein
MWRSGRARSLTSTASTIRPFAAVGSASDADVRRSRSSSTRLWLSASYNAPCPRRCSATRVGSTSEVTGPSTHSTASANSNSALSPDASPVANRRLDSGSACAAPAT